MCAVAENGKSTKTPYFESSRTFKITNVDIIKKLVTGDKRYVCAYLQPVSR